MTTSPLDDRSNSRSALDEQIANEPVRPLPEIFAGASTAPLETHLARLRQRPVAVAGVVENGMVRPLDPSVKLTEHARVIIVATETR